MAVPTYGGYYEQISKANTGKFPVIKLIGLCFIAVHLLSHFTLTQRLIQHSNQNNNNDLDDRTEWLMRLHPEFTLRNLTTINKKINHQFDIYNGTSVATLPSSFNASELLEDLEQLETSTNATYFEYLTQKMKLKKFKINRPGSWDGAGIVLEDYKLIFFTQGKVSILTCRYILSTN